MGALARAGGPAPIRRVAVPAGLAVLTWAVLLVVFGGLLRLGPLTIYGALWVGVLGVMLWPVVAFAPWRDRPDERTAAWVRDHRRRLALTAGLAGLVATLQLLDAPGSLLAVLVLPTDLFSGGLYGMAAFYRGLAGPTVAAAVLWFATGYLLGLWLYGIATGLAAVGRMLPRR